jgi:hypothetical protein
VITSTKDWGTRGPVPVGQASQGSLAGPTNPHNSATRPSAPQEPLDETAHSDTLVTRVKEPVSGVDARELGCWRIFQVSALGMIDLLIRKQKFAV